MKSPGRPSSLSREQRSAFWTAIARGASTETASAEAGLSSAVGSRWFRQSGGMAPSTFPELSGRYLSFAEREEIVRGAHMGPVEMAIRESVKEGTV